MKKLFVRLAAPIAFLAVCVTCIRPAKDEPRTETDPSLLGSSPYDEPAHPLEAVPTAFRGLHLFDGRPRLTFADTNAYPYGENDEKFYLETGVNMEGVETVDLVTPSFGSPAQLRAAIDGVPIAQDLVRGSGGQGDFLEAPCSLWKDGDTEVDVVTVVAEPSGDRPYTSRIIVDRETVDGDARCTARPNPEGNVITGRVADVLGI